MNTKKFYITTPIYYPNAKPHIGTLYSTLIADTAARWHKLLGDDVFFLTGTDEHGQKLQEAAEAKGMQPKAFIDLIIPAFQNLWKLYEIDYTKFIRTTDPEHEQGVQAVIKKWLDRGDVYKSTYTGWYCVGCETFVSLSNDAVKDDAGIYLCATHKKPLTERDEEGYFFRLSAYQDQLLEFYKKNPDFIMPKERLNEVISFVESGLKDLSISRKKVTWGIPFPGDPEYTVYVWADALNNYLTGIGHGQNTAPAEQQFNKWWPADVQVMAKDIVRFHAVYWPAFLMALDLPMPKKLLVHGYVLMGENKVSKSLSNSVDPHLLAEWYGVAATRYYLMRQMAITHDGTFDLKDLEERINADLANNLGNLLNRMITLALNNDFAMVNPPAALEAASIALKEKCAEMFRSYREEMNKNYYHMALTEVFKFLSEANAYFQAQKTWTLPAQNKELFAEVVSSICHSLYHAALVLWPVMPTKMEELLRALGHEFKVGYDYEKELRENKWNLTFTLTKMAQPLFVKPESHVPAPEESNAGVSSAAAKFAAAEKPAAADKPAVPEIDIQDFAKVQLAVGTIIGCEPVAGSDKLYKLQVDLGPLGTRQILSGVAKHLAPVDLLNKQGVFVLNLKPRKMLGTESQGMMLFASDASGALRPVTVAGAMSNGAKIS